MSRDGKRTIATIFIEDRLELYDILMKDNPTPAGKALFEAARGLQIQSAVDDLVFSWRRTDYARNLPHLLVTTLPGVAAQAAGSTSDSVPALIIEALLTNVRGRLERGPLRQVEIAVKKMHAKLKRDKRQIIEDEKRLEAETRAYAWRSMLKDHTFQLALSASEVQAYSAFYFAYECFLSAVLESRTGDWPETTTAVGDGLRKVLGASMYDRCWGDRRLEAARHVRDALAHRGGRVQRVDLLGKNGAVRRKATSHFEDLIHVDGDRMLMSATDTRNLFALLYERALEVIVSQQAHEAARTTPGEAS